MTKTVARKMGISEGSRAYFANAPVEAIEAIELPEIKVVSKLTGDFEYIHLFVKTQDEFNDHFPKLKPHLSQRGMLWVSWPKNKQLGTDLNIKKVIELGYNFGLVESTCLSIDKIWSGLKFTRPKEGKIYNNSYGKLKE
jgi:hypothetical protein